MRVEVEFMKVSNHHFGNLYIWGDGPQPISLTHEKLSRSSFKRLLRTKGEKGLEDYLT